MTFDASDFKTSHMKREPAWVPKCGQWEWRKFLTEDEIRFIKESDGAIARAEAQRSAVDRKYGRRRQLIINRAIHRAKYDAKKKAAGAK